MIVRGLSDNDGRTLGLLLDQLDAKEDRNKLRAALYDGKKAARELGISMPPSMRHIAYVLGWCSKAVDLLNTRCRLEGFTSPTDSLANLGLDAVLDDNRFFSESHQGQSSSLIHSVGFLVTTRGMDDEPEVVFTFRDALNATGEWDERQRRLRAFLSVTERGDDGKPRAGVLMLPGRNFDVSKVGGGWKATNERAATLSYVPVEPMTFRPRLGRPFGMSRITRPQISLVEQAMRTLGRSESQAEIFSLPQRYAMGADASMFIDEQGNPIPRWQILLGGVWWAGNNEDGKAPDVGQFPQASQQPHLDHLRAIAQMFAGEASIPLASLGMPSGDANPTSADAYLASREDLIAEAETATDEWGHAYSRSMVTASRLLGTYREGLRVLPKWRNPKHESRAAAADAGQKALAAVPWLAETEVGLELLGLSSEQIERALAERSRSALTSDLALLASAIDRQTQ